MVALLFTDLVGSPVDSSSASGTRPPRRVRKAYVRLLREAVASHSGHEVKNLGDTG